MAHEPLRIRGVFVRRKLPGCHLVPEVLSVFWFTVKYALRDEIDVGALVDPVEIHVKVLYSPMSTSGAHGLRSPNDTISSKHSSEISSSFSFAMVTTFSASHLVFPSFAFLAAFVKSSRITGSRRAETNFVYCV